MSHSSHTCERAGVAFQWSAMALWGKKDGLQSTRELTTCNNLTHPARSRLFCLCNADLRQMLKTTSRSLHSRHWQYIGPERGRISNLVLSTVWSLYVHSIFISHATLRQMLIPWSSSGQTSSDLDGAVTYTIQNPRSRVPSSLSVLDGSSEILL
jgi:hypothetical protein